MSSQLTEVRLTKSQGSTLNPHAARIFIHQAMGVPDWRIGEIIQDVTWWERQVVNVLEGALESGDDITLLGWSRALCFHIAQAMRDRCWVIMARQVWMLRNEVRSLFVQVDAGDGEKALILGSMDVSLWEWAFGGDRGWCEDWPMFCREVLGISDRQARKLERVWETYRLGLGLEPVDIERIGQSKAITALSVVSEDLEVAKGDQGEKAEGGKLVTILDQELRTILFDSGTNRELQEYIRERRRSEEENPGLHRPALKYDDETGRAIFWSSEGVPYPWALGMGDVEILPPPPQLGEDDRRLWIRKRQELAAILGVESWE